MSAHLLNETALRALKRPEIQKLAKREKIKATSKTDAIIDKLLTKFPAGVPSFEKETAIARKSRRIAEARKLEEEVAEQQQHLFQGDATVDDRQANDGPERTEDEDVMNKGKQVGNAPTSQVIQGLSVSVEQLVLAPQLEQDGLATGHSASAAAPALFIQRTLDGAPAQEHLGQQDHAKALLVATESCVVQSDPSLEDNERENTPLPASHTTPPLPDPSSIPPPSARRVQHVSVHDLQPQPEAGPSRISLLVPERTVTLALCREELPEGDAVPAHATPRESAASGPRRAPQPQPEAGPSRVGGAMIHGYDPEDESEPPRGLARQPTGPVVQPRLVHASQRIAFAERPAGTRRIERRVEVLAPSTPPSVHSRTPHRMPTPIPQSSPEPALPSSLTFSPTRPNVWDTPPENGATSDSVDEELAALEKNAKSKRQLDPNRPIIGCSTQGLRRVRHGIKEIMGRVIHVEALDKTMRRMEDSREALPEELEELKRRELKLVAGRMVLEQVLGEFKSKKAGWLDGKAPAEWHQERMHKAAAVREKERRRKEKKEEKKREKAQVVESRVGHEWKLKLERHGLDVSPPRSPHLIPQLPSSLRFNPMRRPRNAPAPFFPSRVPMQQRRSQMPPLPIPRQPPPRVQPVPLQDRHQPVSEEDVVPTPSLPNGRVLPASFHPSGTANYSRSHASQQPEAGPTQVHVAEPQQAPPSVHNVQQGTQADAHLGQPLAPLGSAALMQYYASLPSISTGLQGTAEHSAHAHPYPQAGSSASYTQSSAGPSTGYAESQAGPSMDYSIGMKRRRMEEEDLECEEDAVSYASAELDHGEDGTSYEEDGAHYEENAAGYAEDELSCEENDENDDSHNERQSRAVAARDEQGSYRPRPVPGYNGHREPSPESRWGSVSGYGNWAPARNAPYKRLRYE